MKFKVGDIVVGNDLSNSYYNYTTKRLNFVGEVIGYSIYDMLTVKVLECDNHWIIGDTYDVNEEHFELKCPIVEFLNSLAKR